MKTFIHCLVLAGILGLSGCISAHYHGKTYPPTKELAIYYSRNDLPDGEYQTIGELEVTADTTCSSESINEKIREESMARGADIAIADWFDSRFIIDKEHKDFGKHCCYHESIDKYKYKKVVKVTLMKNKKKEKEL